MRDVLEPANTGGRDREVSGPTEIQALQPAMTAGRTDIQTVPGQALDSGTDQRSVPHQGRALAAPVLLFDHVSKWYGPVIGVNDVTLELRPGIMGLVGANGAGKTTLMRLAT